MVGIDLIMFNYKILKFIQFQRKLEKEQAEVNKTVLA